MLYLSNLFIHKMTRKRLTKITLTINWSASFFPSNLFDVSMFFFFSLRSQWNNRCVEHKDHSAAIHFNATKNVMCTDSQSICRQLGKHSDTQILSLFLFTPLSSHDAAKYCSLRLCVSVLVVLSPKLTCKFVIVPATVIVCVFADRYGHTASLIRLFVMCVFACICKPHTVHTDQCTVVAYAIFNRIILLSLMHCVQIVCVLD